MYLPSDTPLLQGQRECAARKQACSAARVAATQQTMAEGRVGIFENIISPQDILTGFGVGAAVNAQKLQNQTLSARATGMLGIDSGEDSGPSVSQLIADAPTVISLNRQPDQAGCTDIVFSQQLVGPDPTPSFPHMAPNIVQTDFGPMYFRGKDATYPGAYPSGMSGLTGYNPPWSDAFVMTEQQGDTGVGGWIQNHPWLSLVIAGAGLFALSRKGRR